MTGAAAAFAVSGWAVIQSRYPGTEPGGHADDAGFQAALGRRRGGGCRLLSPVPDTAARLTWLATTGAALASMICACACGVAWVISIRTPSAFISATSSRPRALMPFQCGGPSISASAKALKQVWVAN